MGKQDRSEARDGHEKVKRAKTQSDHRRQTAEPEQVPPPVLLNSGERQAPPVFLFLNKPMEKRLVRDGENYVSVFGFWVHPRYEPLYIQVATQHGHIASDAVFPDANLLVSHTLNVLDVVGEMVDAGDHPSVVQLQSWRRTITNASNIRFNIGWLDTLWQEAETKANARRDQLPGIIAGLEERVASVRIKLEALQETQERLIRETSKVVDQIIQAKKTLEEEEQLLVDASAEMAEQAGS
ncbi:uncharacterized protein LOC113361479 [Papaver somniferum]|nr:uncharacterized protein LOC113361479 [Papaver somniferum]